MDMSNLLYDDVASISMTVHIVFYLKLEEQQIADIYFEHKSLKIVPVKLSLETCIGAGALRSQSYQWTRKELWDNVPKEVDDSRQKTLVRQGLKNESTFIDIHKVVKTNMVKR